MCGAGSNSGLCTDALVRGGVLESGHAFSSITMQDNTTGFLPTVVPLGDVISKQSIIPKKSSLIAISRALCSVAPMLERNGGKVGRISKT